MRFFSSSDKDFFKYYAGHTDPARFGKSVFFQKLQFPFVPAIRLRRLKSSNLKSTSHTAPPTKKSGWLAGWLADCLAGWQAGWLTGWLVGWLAVWPAGWWAGWLADWLVGWLAGSGRLGISSEGWMQNEKLATTLQQKPNKNEFGEEN